MRRQPKIGEYRHTPAHTLPGTRRGAPRSLRTPRRFPHLGVVVLAYAMAGPLACALVSQLFNTTGLAAYLPKRFEGAALPPAPSLQNVLFGVGPQETAIAAGLVGWWLWRLLWTHPVPPETQARGIAGVLPALLSQALLLGPILAFAAIPIGAYGFFLRTAPQEIPVWVRPLFGLVAAPINTLFAVLTGVVPLVVILLGLLLGAVTAVAVAVLWQHFPEEPELR